MSAPRLESKSRPTLSFSRRKKSREIIQPASKSAGRTCSITTGGKYSIRLWATEKIRFGRQAASSISGSTLRTCALGLASCDRSGVMCGLGRKRTLAAFLGAAWLELRHETEPAPKFRSYRQMSFSHGDYCSRIGNAVNAITPNEFPARV